MDKKKPGALTIMVGAPASPPKGGAMGGMGMGGGSDGSNEDLGLAAAQEAMLSIKNGNPKGFWESFKAMMEACRSYEGGGEE